MGTTSSSAAPATTSLELGDGDDTFVWNPGDGSDTVDGQGGSDTMVFNGSDAAEKFDISANGSRVRFTRDVGNITMDLGGIEVVDLNALGGADTITVNDLTGTDVHEIALDLAGVAGGNTGDAQLDTIVVNDSNGSDSSRSSARPAASSSTAASSPAAGCPTSWRSRMSRRPTLSGSTAMAATTTSTQATCKLR